MGMVNQHTLCAVVCQKAEHLKICHSVIQSAAQRTVKHQPPAALGKRILRRQQNIRIVFHGGKRFHIFPLRHTAQGVKVTHDPIRHNTKRLRQFHPGIRTDVEGCRRDRRLLLRLHRRSGKNHCLFHDSHAFRCFAVS